MQGCYHGSRCYLVSSYTVIMKVRNALLSIIGPMMIDTSQDLSSDIRPLSRTLWLIEVQVEPPLK